MDRYLKKVPPTDINNYISGFEALNIVSSSGKMRDWHPLAYLSADNNNEYLDLYKGNSILGDYGIEHRDIPFLKAKGVYIANHFRAYIDYILKVNSLAKDKKLPALKEILWTVRDFFDNDEEYRELYRLLKIVKPILDTEIYKEIIMTDFAKLYLEELKKGKCYDY